MAAIDLYLVAGQSNAEGRGNSSLSPSVNSTYGKKYETGSTISPLADPVGGANTGSAWPAFGNAVLALHLAPLCITEAAVGSTYLLTFNANNWAPGGTLYNAAVAQAGAATTALTNAGWTPTFRGVLWHQGEFDANDYGGTAAALQTAYQAALISLYNSFHTDLGGAMFVFQLGQNMGATDTDKWIAVRAAQAAACTATDGMHLVYTNCINFPSLGFQTPGLHYNQAGYNAMGTGGGTAVARLLYRASSSKVRVHGGALAGVGGSMAEVP